MAWAAPPPPPEGTPEYHEWAERYAHLRPDVQAEVARVRAEIAPQKAAPSEAAQGMDLAEWKAYDNEQLARCEAAKAADRAFDAEVSGLTPEAWYQAQQRAVALHIEQVQQQARGVCARSGEGSLECAQAWEQANQRVLDITLEAGLRPQTLPPPPGIETGVQWLTSIGLGAHASGGLILTWAPISLPRIPPATGNSFSLVQAAARPVYLVRLRRWFSSAMCGWRNDRCGA